jgi:hypothetical protein
MRSLTEKSFSTAVRRLLADRRNATRGARLGTNAGRRRPSAKAMRRELESFRRAQGAAYWHHDGPAS